MKTRHWSIRVWDARRFPHLTRVKDFVNACKCVFGLCSDSPWLADGRLSALSFPNSSGAHSTVPMGWKAWLAWRARTKNRGSECMRKQAFPPTALPQALRMFTYETERSSKTTLCHALFTHSEKKPKALSVPFLGLCAYTFFAGAPIMS